MVRTQLQLRRVECDFAKRRKRGKKLTNFILRRLETFFCPEDLIFNLKKLSIPTLNDEKHAGEYKMSKIHLEFVCFVFVAGDPKF